ncbi:class I SAM-dependent methyltransferase [Cerasicoccus frondis]|uniref:class I SAM-dependent methyltransferase n=1 Tax=Cerasicoccus frondis TaxID=490090 RepID=UPI002852D110|nr:class I SAM-dependent methyltransferase [Cerasicoccus frondis]
MIDPAEYYRSLDKEEIACPITQSTNWKALAYGDRYQMGIETKINLDSGFIATNPVPTEEALVSFYRDHYRDFYFSFPDPEAQEYLDSENYRICKRRAEWLFDYLSGALSDKPARVLDIGCADGLFLEKMSQQRPTDVLTGVEPDEKYATKAASSSGATVHNEGFQTFFQRCEADGSKYDVVVLSHVLEHLTHPDQKIFQIGNLLVDDGLLLIEVPNILSPTWWGPGMFHIGHVNQFYPETLVMLLQSQGFALNKLFHGIHPADTWAMTGLFVKQKKPDVSLYKLPDDAHVNIIGNLISYQSTLPRDGQQSRFGGPFERILKKLKA